MYAHNMHVYEGLFQPRCSELRKVAQHYAEAAVFNPPTKPGFQRMAATWVGTKLMDIGQQLISIYQ
jgi:hypothetical protein